MSIEELSWDENISNRKNNNLLPKSIRGLIIGKSNCGKTNLVLNLLLKDFLDYDNLQVFGKSLYQPKYKIIKTGFEQSLPKEFLYQLFKNKDYIIGSGLSPDKLLQEASKKYSSKTPIKCCFYENADEIPDPSKLKATDKNLIIFDDILLEKQNKCEDYYTRGRHSNVDCFYLAQNYFELPRRTIRENSNFLCFFKQDARNLNNIYQDHVSMDMPLEEFKDLCNICWKEKFGFLVIDNSSEIYNGKYRYKLDNFYFPKNLS